MGAIDYSKWDNITSDVESDDEPALKVAKKPATKVTKKPDSAAKESTMAKPKGEEPPPFVMPTDPYEVTVEIVDMSKGLMKMAGEVMLGVKLDGVFHCNVHVHGKTTWFHLDGAHSGPAAPGDGAHVTFEARGRTSRTADEVDEWFAASPYAADNYDLWSRNCNHFADALLAFLGVAPLPAMVTEVPAKVLASPMGAMLRPTIDKAVAVLRDSSDGGDGSMVDRFLETVVEQPGGLLVAPIVKMMRSIAA